MEFFRLYQQSQFKITGSIAFHFRGIKVVNKLLPLEFYRYVLEVILLFTCFSCILIAADPKSLTTDLNNNRIVLLPCFSILMVHLFAFCM